MQNRYVGEIGDYLKLGTVRALSPGYRLGVAWWLLPDENRNKDRRHIDYVKQPAQWRQFDPPLFDALGEIVRKIRGAGFAGNGSRSSLLGDNNLSQRSDTVPL
jgi:hypothetical protein